MDNKSEDMNQEKKSQNVLTVNSFIIITEQYAKVNVEQIMDLEDNEYVLMFVPKASDLMLIKFEVSSENRSIISKVITRPTSDNFSEEEEKKIDSDIKYSPLYIEEADNCYIVHLGKLPGKKTITIKTSFIQQITSADMSYQYIIFNKFPELKTINGFEERYSDNNDSYLNISDKDLDLIEIEKINWVMRFIMNSKFERFIEHLDCKKGYYLLKKFYNDKKKCIISHTYNPAQKITEYNYFLSGVILFRTQMMNTPLLYKQYSSELNETYYVLSFMFDKNKMLYSQPSEENAEEFKDLEEEERMKKIKNEKTPKKRTTNRGRKKAPPTLEEIEKEKERERIENDEFKDFRNLIEPIENKLKFDEERKMAVQKASRSRKKKVEPKPKPKRRNIKNKNVNEDFAFDLRDIDMNPEKSYFINNQESDIKNSPGLFIILFDQTFSMQGEGLRYLKDSLKKLLAILPLGSYYQLIGFHTFFTMYNETAVEYNQENYLSSIEQIEEMKAEGLTNIYDPLMEVYYNGRYNHINLPRFVILLTDGQIANTEECLELIEQNNNLFTLHAIGIGENFNQDFIRRAGYVGKGGYDFVKNLSNIEEVLSNSATNLMRDYLSNVFVILIDISQEVTKKIVLKSDDSHFIRQDEIFTMIFTVKEKMKEEALEIFFNYNYTNEKEDKNNDKKKFHFINYDFKGTLKTQENLEISNTNVLNYFIRNLPEGNEISHIFMKSLLLNSDSCISPIYQQEYDMALKYQILCKCSELNITEDFKEKEDKEDYENNKPTYKTGIVLKKNILIESFKLMELSMDYYGLEYNYKLGLGLPGVKNFDENEKEEEKDEVDDSEGNKQDKEWYKKKKEILAQTEEINKNVEKINREEEMDSPLKVKDNIPEEDLNQMKERSKRKSKSKKSHRKGGDDDDKENDENIINNNNKNKRSKSVSKAKNSKKNNNKSKSGKPRSVKKSKKSKSMSSDEEDYDSNRGDKESDEEDSHKGEDGDDSYEELKAKPKKGNRGRKPNSKNNKNNKGKNNKKKRNYKKEFIVEKEDSFINDDEESDEEYQQMLNKKRNRNKGGKKSKKENILDFDDF